MIKLSRLKTTAGGAGRMVVTGPQGHLLWGSLRDIQQNRLKFVVDVMRLSADHLS
jgi:hypothetical protein